MKARSSQVARWATGSSDPRFATVTKILEALEVSWHEFAEIVDGESTTETLEAQIAELVRLANDNKERLLEIHGMISRKESKARETAIRDLARLATVLGVEADEIFRVGREMVRQEGRRAAKAVPQATDSDVLMDAFLSLPAAEQDAFRLKLDRAQEERS